MKNFVSCILAVILVATGIFIPVPVSASWEPSSSPPSYVEYGQLLDKQVYSVDNITLEVMLSDYFDVSWNMEPVTVEISRQSNADLVFFCETMEMSFSIDINLQPGVYRLRAHTSTNDVSSLFFVEGYSSLFQLTGGPVAEGEPDCATLLGFRLEWDAPSNGGPYTLTRVNYYGGDIKVFPDIEQTHFFDGSARPGIYLYTVSDGTTSSNTIVADLREYPPLEYSGNKNEKVIVLKIGNPYMYSARDKQSALLGKTSSRIGPIYEDDLGVVPRLVNNRTMIPLAALVRQIGGSLIWDGKKKLVTVIYEGSVLEVPIGSKTVYINGHRRSFDTPARIERNRTLVPIRHLELLNCEVDWVGKSRSIVVCYKGI